MDRRGLVVCHDCMLLLRQSAGRRNSPLSASIPVLRTRAEKTFGTRAIGASIYHFSARARTHSGVHTRQNTSSSPIAPARPCRPYSQTANPTQEELKVLHARVAELTTSALKPDDQVIPTEQRVLYVLEQLDAIVHDLLGTKTTSSADSLSDASSLTSKSKDASGTATSALLGSVNTRRSPSHLSKAALLTLISQKAEEIMRHPTIFLTPAILKSYIDLQTALNQPQSFPDIFHLYSTKPSPSLKGNSEITYTQPNANAARSAVPTPTANKALESALHIRDLPLAIAIINTTYTTPAAHRQKTLRHALLPSVLLTLAPVSAYALAQQFSLIQTTMSPQYATTVAFAGFMTYLGTVSVLGYVVITTANDQMERVTWAKGVPLWERWVREEERAAWDRVAMTWGFSEKWRRGEEEGEEWELLREEVGSRGMVLDRVELMEGME